MLSDGPKFLEWLRKTLGPNASVWLMVIAVIACFAIILAADSVVGTAKPEKFTWPWMVAMASKVATIGVTGLLSGGVLKLLAMQGYFHSTLAQVVHGERGFELLDHDQRLSRWHTLTRLIYLPSLHQRVNSNTSELEFTKLAEDVATEMGNRFSYKEPFYIKEQIREITITWADANRKAIQIKEHYRVTVIPFQPDALQWVSSQAAQQQLTLAAYHITTASFLVNSDKIEPVKEEVSKDGKNKRQTFELKGASSYNLLRDREITLPLDTDPNWSLTSPYVIAGGRVRIENKAAGLQVLFDQVAGGADGLFVPDFKDRSGPIREGEIRRYKQMRVMVPQDGYELNFVRIQP